MMTPDSSSALWRTSSYSDANGGHCVEVAAVPGVTAVRDTRNRDLAILAFRSREWRAFIKGVRAGEFDIPN